MIDSIELRDWGWRHHGRNAWALRHVNLRIDAGQRVLLLGASGVGKSTLLSALAGLLGPDEGEEEGELLVGGARPAPSRGLTALVMQNPESQIVLSRVGDDVAFGAENLCVPRSEIWQRVAASLRAVDLTVELDRSTDKLSGGQQQRLVVSGALAMGAQWVLLDEPTANLDAEGISEVRLAVGSVVADRHRGMVVVEHRPQVWMDIVDRVVVLSESGIIADGTPEDVFACQGDDLAAMGVWVPSVTEGTGSPGPVVIEAREPAPCVARHEEGDRGAPILRAIDLSVGYAHQAVRDGINLEIPKGLSTVITGPNGAGKTTTLLTLAGLLPAVFGQIVAADELVVKGTADPLKWTSRELLTRIGMVFQNPEHQFVSSTVYDEIAVGLVALKRPKSEIARRVTDLLERLRLDHLAKANPFTLSGGEKRRLSVATVLATDPAVICLDEPTFGQDRITWNEMVDLITSIRDSGTTIVAVTHDEAFVEALGDHRIDMGSFR